MPNRRTFQLLKKQSANAARRVHRPEKKLRLRNLQLDDSAVATMALLATVLKIQPERKLNLTTGAETNVTDYRLAQ